MRMRAVGVLCVLGACGLVQAQPPQPPAFRTGVAVVEVSAVVTDASGRPVGDLTAADFEVLEDGQPRPITSFRRLVAGRRDITRDVVGVEGARLEALATNAGVADAPAFVLVLDDLNTSPYDAHRAIRAGLGVLGAIPQDALVAVVMTSGLGGSLLTLTPPGPDHAASIREFRGRVLLSGPKPNANAPQTRSSSVDAPCGVGSAVLQSQDCGDPTRAAQRAEVIDAVARVLSHAGSRRKVVFWITEDMGVSPLDPRGNQAAQRAMLQRVLNADVAVYPVNPREGHADARDRAEIVEGDRGDNRPDRRSGGRMRVGMADSEWGGKPGTTVELNTDEMVAVTLDQVARESGGRWITNANDLHTVLAEVVVQNSTSYVLAFEAEGTQTPGRHRIDVRVTRQGTRVFARRGYVVAEASVASAVADAGGPVASRSTLLRDIAFGSVPQGQLAMTVQAVPEFATGREGRALVTVRVDAASAGDSAVELAVISVADDGKVGETQAFRMSRPDDGAHWELTTPLALGRGGHQVRVAAVTDDGARTGLVIVPVEIVQPGRALMMAPPVLLMGAGGAAPAPTLARAVDSGVPVGLQVEVAGRAVRDEAVAVTAAFRDDEGRSVREVDAVLDAGTRPDVKRATAVVPTAGLAPGDYVLVVEARGPDPAATVRHAVPVTIGPPPEALSTSAPAAGASVTPLPVASGPSTRHPAAGGIVIRDEAAWHTFWEGLPTSQRPPDIDFARVTLFAVVVDAEPTAPVQPVVERVEREGDGLVVHWRLGKGPAAPAVDAGFPYRPFTVVGVIGHDGPVRFVTSDAP